MGGNNHNTMAMMTAAATMRGGHWCQCDDVTINHNEVKNPRVAAAASLADERLQPLLSLQTRGVLPVDGHLRQTGGTGGRKRRGQ